MTDESCPIPASRYDRIVLGHGSGGRLTANLIAQVFLPAFRNDVLDALEDQATLTAGTSRIAFTTDSYVVKPIFFPGGDIGRLAVCGTVNDLAVGGAEPLFLSAAFILEEGFAVERLARVVDSMRRACEEARVTLVTGDTKVVDRGKGDEIFITTSGIGLAPRVPLSVANARAGDRVIVSGTIGDHGVAILSVREGLEFETILESDCAPLADLVRTIMNASDGVRCMRDPTRGGLASTLNEIAGASCMGITIDESRVPIRDEVAGACEMLGLDPLHVACEGKLVAIVDPRDADRVVEAMRAHRYGKDAAVIGEVVADRPRIVTMRTTLGTERIVALLAGEQLPRIC